MTIQEWSELKAGDIVYLADVDYDHIHDPERCVRLIRGRVATIEHNKNGLRYSVKVYQLLDTDEPLTRMDVNLGANRWDVNIVYSIAVADPVSHERWCLSAQETIAQAVWRLEDTIENLRADLELSARCLARMGEIGEQHGLPPLQSPAAAPAARRLTLRESP